MRLTLVLLVACLGISNCKTEDKKILPPHRVGPHRPIIRPPCKNKPTIVAVIDTGFGIDSMNLKVRLCQFGHKDFSGGITTDKYGTKDLVPVDNNGHGTHIAGIIDGFASKSNVNYCLVIIKYYKEDAFGEANLRNTISAINYAKNIHADYINYSGGGIKKSDDEVKAVKEYIDAGGKFVAAAGNEGSNLDYRHYYPAQDDPRVIVVGSVDQDGNRVSSSNFGDSVKRTELGKDVPVCDETMCMKMTGTSQAAAAATGKLLAQEKNTCN